MRHLLHPHPDTLDPPPIRIEVGLARVDLAKLIIGYTLVGAIDDLRIPAPAQAERADDLWRHLCCEAFLGIASSEAYAELNFSPSRRWASYSFSSYRSGMTEAADPHPESIITSLSSNRISLNANVYLGDADFDRLALSAVIEESSGRKSYWALAHPAAKPDFHHPDSFVLTLPEPQ